MQFSLPINSNILKILGEWLFPVIAALTGEAILNNLRLCFFAISFSEVSIIGHPILIFSNS